MKSTEQHSCGFCPFRVEKMNFQPGCVLRMGYDSLCYTHDARPLYCKKDEEITIYYCPFMKFELSKETYNEIEEMLSPLLAIQDEENVGISLWPIFSENSKIIHPRREMETNKGKRMQHLSQKLRKELQDIVFERS
ncbi:MAG: hypothetical protein ACTSR2_12465 [Candidatus Hodarchaeales archaeon]